MIKYKIHFINPENNYSITKEFTEKDLPFKPDKTRKDSGVRAVIS